MAADSQAGSHINFFVSFSKESIHRGEGSRFFEGVVCFAYKIFFFRSVKLHDGCTLAEITFRKIYIVIPRVCHYIEVVSVIFCV